MSFIQATLRKPVFAVRVEPHRAGRLVNQIKEQTQSGGWLPRVTHSSDPIDDLPLALSE
jgi:hypothetical protein